MSNVRPVEPGDLPLLAGIEAAGDRMLVGLFGPELFTEVSTGAWRAAQPGFLRVVGRPPVGFAHVLEEEDGAAHLQQLVVDPAHARRGLGSALVDAACAEATRRGHDRLSLTTFRDVIFNRPFYERLGFVVVDEPDGLLARHLQQERAYAALGPRVGMVRRL